MSCQVHSEARRWLAENERHRDKWIKRWENIGAGSALFNLFPFLTNAAVFNFLLARGGGNFVEKAVSACLEEKDCSKAENWFKLAKVIAKLV